MRMWLRKKRRYKWFAVLLLLLVITVIFIFFKRCEPVFKERAVDTAAQNAKNMIDDVVCDVIKDGDYIKESALGDITYCDIDTYSLNKLRTDVSNAISDKISKNYYTTVYISLGSLFNNASIQGYGPRIPVRIYFGSVSRVDIKDEFISAGINQTKYRVSLDINVSVSVISFLYSESREIVINVPVTERILVGKVPSYYIQGKG